MKNRSEKVAGRGQILTILQVNSHSIDQKSGEIWTGQALLRPITFKSDRLLVFRYLTAPDNVRLRATLNAEWPLQKPVLIYTQI